MAEIGIVGSLWGCCFSFQMYLETAIEEWRYKTFYSKEPETLAWIDMMKPGEILYDIGANIGIYTLYAAARGIQVVAVEPVLENYMRLIQNIELNHFKNVIPIYGACGDSQGFATISIPTTTIGASGAQLEEGKGITRTIPCYDIEGIFSALPLRHPDHIKVDVDGKEEDILGAYDYYINYVKSILVEINPESWPLEEAIRVMANFGMIPDAHLNLMDPHSSDRRKREGIKAVNMVFVKA